MGNEDGSQSRMSRKFLVLTSELAIYVSDIDCWWHLRIFPLLERLTEWMFRAFNRMMNADIGREKFYFVPWRHHNSDHNLKIYLVQLLNC